MKNKLNELCVSPKESSLKDMMDLYEAIIRYKDKAAALRLAAEGLFRKGHIPANVFAGTVKLAGDLGALAKRQKTRILEVYPTASVL